ncbi:MAG: patatin-like phospholipase family protein [Gammaproteobacteria bacterium]|nr:patatin-like phospholipase family protein [Gammaproteobacteria bacterium]
MGRFAAGIVSLVALLAAAAHAAPPAASDAAAAGARLDTHRPRICLVLSGGGARGLAQIGVLEVLERLRVPIDCVAGTSMGAVIGGLYASGMTPEQIDHAVRTLDWQEAFRDRPPRQDLGFRRKQDDRNFLVRLPIGLKHGRFLFPKGLIEGQKLQETLRRLTLPDHAIRDFDRLPTPFRAVATDLETGEAVVLHDGDLVEAMRASMSAPGLFAPVDSHGRLLVDGGLAENLPIDVARRMGADVLIVVDVSFPLQKRAHLDSALAISNQMLAILVRRDAERQKRTLGARDVLIEPDLGLTGSADFQVAAQTIRLGAEAALAMRTRLAALSVDPAAYRRYVERRERSAVGARPIRFVRVDAASKPYEKTILAIMRPLIGKPLDAARIARGVTELDGLGLFESVDYRVVSEGQGDGRREGIEVRVRRKSWGPNYVRFGLNLQDDFQGDSQYNAAVRFLKTEVNGLGAEWLTDLQIGSNPKAYTEFYQPLSARRRWFVAPSARVEMRDLRVYARDVEIADFREREAEADFDVGRELGNWGEVRLGVHRVNGNSRARFGDPTLVDRNFNNGELFFKFSYDRLDSVDFPRSGQTSSLQWDAYRSDLGSDLAADRLSANWLMARSRGRDTLMLWTSAGTTLRNTIKPTSLQDFFTLGGFLNLSGLAAQSLNGPTYAIGRGVYFRQIGHGGEGLLEFPAYLGMSFEAGNVWQQRGEVGWGSARKDVSVFLGLDTFLGPLYLGGGYDTRGVSAYYLFLGRTF